MALHVASPLGPGGERLQAATNSRRRRVAIFGLSANPPTHLQGHAGIVRHVRTLFDEVWVLPVYQHIYASKRTLAPFEDRVTMCRAGFEAAERRDAAASASASASASAALDGGCVRVLEVEREVAEDALAAAARDGAPLESVRVGSVDVLRHLCARHPEVSFTWVMGEDSYRDLVAGKWKEGDAFRAGVPLMVVRRRGLPLADGGAAQAPASATGDTAEWCDVPGMGAVSSTAVRAALQAGDWSAAADALHPEVLDHIRRHGLYGVPPP